ncbi:unnamed protein product [Protopolystoma xenopodis]|uniref:Uncharacterized protein n=1 Tax=Protopolystoma xenopodis TaxID=117903 RepID=A0A3S5B4Y1_9PLAT|nr:unnamed protein product [Protopolystoma xenopodis]
MVMTLVIAWLNRQLSETQLTAVQARYQTSVTTPGGFVFSSGEARRSMGQLVGQPISTLSSFPTPISNSLSANQAIGRTERWQSAVTAVSGKSF